jgi:predicted secreted Zn-dependent protease
MSQHSQLYRLTDPELALVIEALAKSASRHESQARSVKFGRAHDDTAEAMRALRSRLTTERRLR